MSYPPFDQPTSSAYDAVAVKSSELPKPAGCHIYAPDNYDDYTCLALWQPAPELGARKWTRNGRRILIGLYRDQGRGVIDSGLTVDFTCSITNGVFYAECSGPHYLKVGDAVTWTYPPGSPGIVTEVINDTTVRFTSTLTIDVPFGQLGESLSCGKIDTADTYVIARLLPTFRPVPWAEVLEILAECNPEEFRETVSLTNITTGDVQLNSEVRPLAVGSTLYRRHRQQMDELSKPLRQVYDARGRPIPPDLRFSKRQNAALYLTAPMTNQWDPIPTANPYLPVYDYYGFPINDRRDPLHRTDIVSYDPDSPNGIKRLVLGNGSAPVYAGPLFDVFGDFVVGARANNTLITRKPVQPIMVDLHNTPFKQPQRRR